MEFDEKIESVPKKFNSSHPFPHDFPYQKYYAEKVPLLNVFRMIVAHFVAHKLTKNILSKIAGRFEKFLAVECGVYKGNSLIACAQIARDFGINFHFYGLDTFQGLPLLSEKDRSLAPLNAPYLDRAVFSDTSVSEVSYRIREKGLQSSVTLVPGLFKDTLSTLSRKNFWFVSIDCDLYEPHLECLEFFYPRMKPGGIIFFDDYHSIEYPMARAAIDEFLSDKCEKLFHLRYGDDKPNSVKSFLIKH